MRRILIVNIDTYRVCYSVNEKMKEVFIASWISNFSEAALKVSLSASERSNNCLF